MVRVMNYPHKTMLLKRKVIYTVYRIRSVHYPNKNKKILMLAISENTSLQKSKVFFKRLSPTFTSNIKQI